MIDKKEEAIVISIDGNPVIKMASIKGDYRRIGSMKNEMENFNLSLEELDSIEVDDFGL